MGLIGGVLQSMWEGLYLRDGRVSSGGGSGGSFSAPSVAGDAADVGDLMDNGAIWCFSLSLEALVLPYPVS